MSTGVAEALPTIASAPDRTVRGVHPLAYVAVLAVYVAAGFAWKTVVLNWIVGPAFPLLALFVLPRILPRRRTRRRSGG